MESALINRELDFDSHEPEASGWGQALESPLIENAEVPTVYLMATAASFQNRD